MSRIKLLAAPAAALSLAAMTAFAFANGAGQDPSGGQNPGRSDPLAPANFPDSRRAYRSRKASACRAGSLLECSRPKVRCTAKACTSISWNAPASVTTAPASATCAAPIAPV